MGRGGWGRVLIGRSDGNRGRRLGGATGRGWAGIKCIEAPCRRIAAEFAGPAPVTNATAASIAVDKQRALADAVACAGREVPLSQLGAPARGKPAGGGGAAAEPARGARRGGAGGRDGAGPGRAGAGVRGRPGQPAAGGPISSQLDNAALAGTLRVAARGIGGSLGKAGYTEEVTGAGGRG